MRLFFEKWQFLFNVDFIELFLFCFLFFGINMFFVDSPDFFFLSLFLPAYFSLYTSSCKYFFPFSLMLRVWESTLEIYCHRNRNNPISKYWSWSLHNFDYIHSTISIFSFKWFLFNYFKKFSIVRSTMFFIVLCRNDPGNFFVLKIKWDIIKTTYLFLLLFFCMLKSFAQTLLCRFHLNSKSIYILVVLQ